MSKIEKQRNFDIVQTNQRWVATNTIVGHSQISTPFELRVIEKLTTVIKITRSGYQLFNNGREGYWIKKEEFNNSYQLLEQIPEKDD